MTVTGERYTVVYEPGGNQVDFEGVLRSGNADDLESLAKFLRTVHQRMNGSMHLNFRKLRYMSASGIRVLADFLRYVQQEGTVGVQLIGSKVITWEEKTLPSLTMIGDRIEFVIHDEGFYDSQELIEDAQFIPLLRNQTRLLWPQEKEILVRHGLREGMNVADICCGCGDVAVLIARELSPTSILGVDHSGPGVEYAMRLQREAEVANADFRMGDATALMIEDDRFDFVLCRLSLQIFSQPEQIMSELKRITKPGGRVYLLGEDYDLIVGYPNHQQIRDVYSRAGHYGSQMGMDLYNGKRLYSILSNFRMRNIRLDYVHVDTVNSDRRAFAEVVKSWRFFSSDVIGEELDIGTEDYATLRAGYDAHLETINHPFGYSTWSLVAASGEKV